MKNSFETASSYPEALKSEHLNEGVRPIIASIGDEEYFMNHGIGEKNLKNPDMLNPDETQIVDYFENPEELQESGFKNNGLCSYAFSPINKKDKFSEEYFNCTGIVVAGRDAITGQEISFLSHQYPRSYLEHDPKKFIEDLVIMLNEIKTRCVKGTIDAVIFGGNYIKDDERRKKEYLESMKLFSEKIKQTLGFIPVVISGPKNGPGEDKIFYDNKERRMYIIKPKVGNKFAKSYTPSELNTTEKEWVKDSN